MPNDLRADLRHRLLAYVPDPGRETQHHLRMTALLEGTGNPFDRKHFEPGHFTASAFVLSPEKDALLLILHGKLHRWLQPGGHIDADDRDVLAAAQREVAEETGLVDLPEAWPGLFDVDVHDIPPLKNDPGHAHFDVRFLLQARDRHHAAGSDAKAARWVPLTEIDQIATDDSVRRAVNRLRSRLGR